jgi:hypothetical protein
MATTWNKDFPPSIKQALLKLKLIDVTPERVSAEWWAVDTVLRRSDTETLEGAWMVESGKTQLSPVLTNSGLTQLNEISPP